MIELLSALKSIEKSEKKMLEFFSDFEKKRLQRWENWLQMEMLFELNKANIKDLWFEDRYSQDQRVTVPKEKYGKAVSSLDIVYRKPNDELFVGVELKVKDAVHNAIRGSLIDLHRIGAVAPAQWGFKAIYAVSIFKPTPNNSKYKEIASNFGTIEKFGPYQAAIFGWEAKSERVSSSRQTYRQWLDKIRTNCGDLKISLHG